MDGFKLKAGLALFALLLLACPVKSQDFFRVTADTLIYYHTHGFDVWEEAMEANGFTQLESLHPIPIEEGPLYTKRDTGNGYQNMSKATDEVYVGFRGSKELEESYFKPLFDEIVSGGRNVGGEGNENYYFYKGHYFLLVTKGRVTDSGAYNADNGVYIFTLHEE